MKYELIIYGGDIEITFFWYVMPCSRAARYQTTQRYTSQKTGFFILNTDSGEIALRSVYLHYKGAHIIASLFSTAVKGCRRMQDFCAMRLPCFRDTIKKWK